MIIAYKSKAREIRSMSYLVEQSIDLPKIVGGDVDTLSRKMRGLFKFRVEFGDKQEVET